MARSVSRQTQITIVTRGWASPMTGASLVTGDLTFLIPLAASVAAGAVIGLERELNGSAAGIRTHILVSVASTLLMVMAVHQVQWMGATPVDAIRIDPTRMAHGILTGIGFLGAGVIFRNGSTIRGLTTAASLWLTAVIGMLLGVKFYPLAISAVVITLLVLAGLRLASRLLPKRSHVEIEAGFGQGNASPADQIGAALRAAGFNIVSLNQELAAGNIAIRVICVADPVDDCGRLGKILNGMTNVSTYRIRAKDAKV